jgi:CubicO group peptidase (beta-lactamase class C family)
VTSFEKPRRAVRAVAASILGVALVACVQTSTPSTMKSRSAAPTPSIAVVPTKAPGYGLGALPPLPAGELPADVAGRMEAILGDAMTRYAVPGIAAAVIAADRGTWAGAAGTADGEADLDPDAQFAIGSVTKTIVAAQVLQLVESGGVELDRPIGQYLGVEVPTNGATVRQVLGMRSGIQDLTGDARAICADLAASFSLGDMRTALSESSIFEPGTRFRYTNANYLLAGLLIEQVTGTSVASAVRSGVLSAPGLERLVYQDEERPTPPLAAPFVVLPGEPAPQPEDLLQLGGGYLPARCLAATAGPAGGMASDPMTLARWGYQLYGGSILGDAALADMTAFQDGYGLAAHDHESRFGVPAVGHEGTVPGYVTQLLAFPDDGLAIAVMANTNSIDEESLTSLAGELRDALAP